MAQIPKTKKKRGFKQIGIFLFGTLFGLLFTLVSLFLLGYWAYTSLTLNKIEKLTKQDINIGNESVKDLTISDIVKHAGGIVRNIDTYTIAQLEKDFNITIIGEGGFIPATMYGLDLTILRDSSKSTIKDDINKVIDSASLDTVVTFLNKSDDELGIFATIINTDVTYYYDSASEKLYTSADHTKEVDFDYSVSTDKSKIKLSSHDDEFQILNGEVNVPFKYVPITNAFSDFNAVTDNLAVGELLGYYEYNGEYYEDQEHNKKVDGFVSSVAKKTISELTTFVDDAQIYEIMGYVRMGDEDTGYTYYEYYNGPEDNKEVNGVLKTIAGKTINELSNSETFNSLYVYEILNYKRTGSPENYTYTDEENKEVTGFMKAIAGYKISELSDSLDTMTLDEILDLDGKDSGVLNSLKDTPINKLSEKIENMTLGEALGVEEDTATGIIKTLYSSKITELNSKLNPDTLTVGEALGYHKKEEDGKYYKKLENGSYSDEVTGLMATLADKTINGIENGINDIYIKDLLPEESPIVKLFTAEELNDLKVSNMSDKLVAKINTTTIGELVNAGILTEIDTSTDFYNSVLKDLSIKEALKMLDEISKLQKP